MLGGGPPGAPGTGAPGAVGALGEEEDSGSDIVLETERDESDHFSYLLNEDNICPIVSKTQVNLLYYLKYLISLNFKGFIAYFDASIDSKLNVDHLSQLISDTHRI